MAQRLANELSSIPGITLTQKVEANGVFAILPKRHITALQKSYFFYVWNEETSEARFMTSFDTKDEDIDGFISEVKRIIG
jgi:threonine aldolase